MSHLFSGFSYPDPYDVTRFPGEFGTRRERHTLYDQKVFGGRFNLDITVELRRHGETYSSQVLSIDRIWSMDPDKPPPGIQARMQPEYMQAYRHALSVANEVVRRHYQGTGEPQIPFMYKDPEPSKGKTDKQKAAEKRQENLQKSVERRLSEQKPGDPLPPASEAEIRRDKALREQEKGRIPDVAREIGEAATELARTKETVMKKEESLKVVSHIFGDLLVFAGTDTLASIFATIRSAVVNVLMHIANEGSSSPEIVKERMAAELGDISSGLVDMDAKARLAAFGKVLAEAAIPYAERAANKGPSPLADMERLADSAINAALDKFEEPLAGPVSDKPGASRMAPKITPIDEENMVMGSWNFNLERDAAIRELIKLAEKTEADNDMEQVQEIAKRDADLLVANPESQEAMLKAYGESMGKGLSGFFSSPFVKELADKAAEYRQKSKQHLDPLMTKYVTAKPIFEQEYDLTFINSVLDELNKKWLGSQQPGTYTKLGEETPGSAKAPQLPAQQAPQLSYSSLRVITAASDEDPYPGLVEYRPGEGMELPQYIAGDAITFNAPEQGMVSGQVLDAWWAPDLGYYVYRVDVDGAELWAYPNSLVTEK